LHGHDRRACGELRLGERVDLRARESVAAPWVRVRRDVKAIRVRTDVRVVTEIRPWIRTAGVGPIIGDVDPVDVPRAGGVRRLRDRDVEMVDESERAVWTRLQCQRDKEEALRRGVVVARRVRDELAANTGGAFG